MGGDPELPLTILGNEGNTAVHDDGNATPAELLIT